MPVQAVWLATILLVLVSGCTTGPLPGGAGEVSGPLGAIELYTERPESDRLYPTAVRDRFFASDKQVYVVSRWRLPGPGNYVSNVALKRAAGTIYREREYRFRAEASSWFTSQRMDLPEGLSAQVFAGPWQVDVSLDGTPVGQRTFTLDPNSIRLRTDARLVVLQGKDDPSLVLGGWRWTRDEYGVLENAKAALRTFRIVLRDELARRFPHVEGPGSGSTISDASILLTPNVGFSPNPSIGSQLELEVVHVPTKVVRKFRLKTSEGYEERGASGVLHFGAAAADLAFKAASNPEVLEFLATVSQAVPQ